MCKKLKEKLRNIFCEHYEVVEVKEDLKKNDPDLLLACYVLTMRHMDGYGEKRILDRLKYVDYLLELVEDGKASSETYGKEIPSEVKLAIYEMKKRRHL